MSGDENRSEGTPSSRDYYDAIAHGYNELHGEEQREKYQLLARELRLATDARVLDVGAGTGLGYPIIPSVGIDPSPGLLKQHPHPDSVVGKAEALPFPDNSFDAVISVTALHHAEPRAAIAEMRRVSRGPVAITILKKSPHASAIVAEAIRQLQPLRIIDMERDHVLVHEPVSTATAHQSARGSSTPRPPGRNT